VPNPAKPQEKIAILGVSAQYHDSAACLVVDGEIIAAAHEERFTRIKGDASLPVESIKYVLKEGNIGPKALSAVVFYESPFAKLDRILATQLVGKAKGVRMFAHSINTWLPKKLWIARQLGELLGTSVPVMMADHHLSHAASAFYPSPFEDSAILTVDGVGEWTTTSIFKGSSSTIEPIEQVEYPNSLGMLYSAFTLFCGFKINSGEYKLMGLAPYGTPRFLDKILTEVLHLEKDGSYVLNPKYFSYMTSPRTYNKLFEELFGLPTRKPNDPLTKDYADIAASIQEATNLVMLALARRAKDSTGSSNLCLAGGVALNVVSIGAIERSGLFDNVWVQPAAGDAGGSLGAALWASYERFSVDREISPNDSMKGSLLGPTPSYFGPSSKDVLDSYKLVYEELDDAALAQKVATFVSNGEVVAIAKGHMEFGPRALGSRSILADARDESMQLRLNMKTKFREGFRPFAPIVLQEDAHLYFETSGKDSPYMLKTYYVNKDLRLSPEDSSTKEDETTGKIFYKKAQEVRSSLPSITHVDYSARVQTVDKERHSFLHKVLSSFKDLTNCSVLVNTSFNVRGEPIVASATDAVECFLHTDVDVLVLDGFIIRKDVQTKEALKPKKVSARGDD
jgi:carbamoyltransferase